MPVEPPPTPWALPRPGDAADDVVAVGADLAPGTLLAAYRQGMFPMRLVASGPLAWWSPDPRGVIPLDGFHVSRSLRRSARRFEIRVDTAFAEVIRGCADPARPAGWIDQEFVAAYTRLHELGWVHSVEAWTRGESPTLAGGLYGVAIGGLFAGESMFHRVRDASKVALAGLVARMRTGGGTLLDVQWCTEHLATLGAVELARSDYLARVETAVSLPQMALS